MLHSEDRGVCISVHDADNNPTVEDGCHANAAPHRSTVTWTSLRGLTQSDRPGVQRWDATALGCADAALDRH